MNHDAAHRAVRAAVKRGDLVRPTICARCGEAPAPARDGRSQIHGHHHDYAKPLDVEWICAKCHRTVTPLPSRPGGVSRGSKNGQAKLTEEIVAEIRASKENGAAIARRLGVDRSTVNKARRKALWKGVGS